MRYKTPYYFFWLARLPLLLLYVSFFIVQLFYNFDIAYRAQRSSRVTAVTTNNQPVQPTFKKAGLPTGKHAKFRLNKRYQPQPAINCEPVAVVPSFRLVSSRLYIHYSNGFIPSTLPSAHSLRGPPVA